MRHLDDEQAEIAFHGDAAAGVAAAVDHVALANFHFPVPARRGDATFEQEDEPETARLLPEVEGHRLRGAGAADELDLLPAGEADEVSVDVLVLGFEFQRHALQCETPRLQSLVVGISIGGQAHAGHAGIILVV
ncbi:hypothetical protein NRB_40730 [Novosphingobium sp. 11B]